MEFECVILTKKKASGLTSSMQNITINIINSKKKKLIFLLISKFDLKKQTKKVVWIMCRP